MQAETVSVKIEAVNTPQLERSSTTIELSFEDLAAINEKDLSKIHIRDVDGNEMLAQAVDTDGDYTADRVIFQADFAPGEAKSFTVSAGSKWVY